jgi:hypothetical protein
LFPRLICSDNAPGLNPATEVVHMQPERHRAPRRSFAASIEIIDVDSDKRIQHTLKT